MSYECVRQRGLFDCGTACLTALLRYHGVVLDPKGMIYRQQVGGTTFFELIQLAKSFGFESMVYQTRDLKSLSYPCIVVIKFFGFRHYWLVYESRGAVLVVMDPALGRLALIRKRTFTWLWTGVFMIIRPQEVTT